ncbi:MAG: hypothetical protein GC200_04650 [Tepidisphaera sp.]|nr:hypothetical protein [Tepidisphaera sp.]
MRTCVAIFSLVAASGLVQAQSFNLQADWSDAANPNGPWSFTQNGVPLPHVNAWQQQLGGWSQPQPAWALSQDATNRLPMFMRSNGSETFAHDWAAGNVVVHSTDGFNGQGDGTAVINFTLPFDATFNIHGGVWIGRDIGRSVDWNLVIGGSTVTGGTVSSGDPYSSANPLPFASGFGGAGPLSGVAPAGTVIALTLPTHGGSPAGDFIVIDLTIDLQHTCIPDLNRDGVADQGDVDYLINVIAGGANPTGIDPDFNGDGVADQGDIDGLINAIAGAPCP